MRIGMIAGAGGSRRFGEVMAGGAYENGRLILDMAINTHSANDLHEHDLEQVIGLEVQGTRIAPVAVPGLEGHHSRGRLEFLAPGLETPFSIVIPDLHDAGAKRFRW